MVKEGDDYEWIDEPVEEVSHAVGTKIFLAPITLETFHTPDIPQIADCFNGHPALDSVAKKVTSVIKLPGKHVLMVTLEDDSDHEKISELVQDPLTGGSRIFVGGKCFRVTVAPKVRSVNGTLYELYFGSFTKPIRILPFQMTLFSKVGVRIKYISFPTNRTSGHKCNFVFVGFGDPSDIDKIIAARKKGAFRFAGREIAIAESQSMVDKNGGKLYAGKGLDEK